MFLNIKPFSVNEAWQGKRFRTPAYKRFTRDVISILPIRKLPTPPYFLVLEFGVSSKAADWDNPIKPFQDILQQRYGFNDRDVMAGFARKKLVAKGEEYIYWDIITFDEKVSDKIDKLIFDNM